MKQRFGWRAHALVRLIELLELEAGWDGYKAKPLPFIIAWRTMVILESIMTDDTPPPAIVPGDGCLQFEWHNLGINADLEVTVFEDEVRVWRMRYDNGEEGRNITNNDYSSIKAWLHEPAHDLR